MKRYETVTGRLLAGAAPPDPRWPSEGMLRAPFRPEEAAKEWLGKQVGRPWPSEAGLEGRRSPGGIEVALPMPDTGQSFRRGTVSDLRDRGAVAGGSTAGWSRYNGFVEEFDRLLGCRLANIRAKVKNNFELGDEFEIALCRVLRELFPDRIGICRGYIVDRNGDSAGDDIIVFDAARFRTPLAPESKEEVPAEVVFAYIEAKYTLYAHAKVRASNLGQSLATACRQIANVKRLVRAEVPLDAVTSRFGQPGVAVERQPGFPVIRNPFYGAVWALNLQMGKLQKSGRAHAMSLRLQEIEDELVWSGHPRELLPDAIAAGELLVVQAVAAPGGGRQVRPFIAPDTERAILCGVSRLATAAVHLRWAIDRIVLGEEPWMDGFDAQLAAAD
ncbi:MULTISPECIES: DUF6602 domain-containing protein [Sorangium]|nr:MULTISPECIES: DUF6602 domain-containing protein [Sorangium]